MSTTSARLHSLDDVTWRVRLFAWGTSLFVGLVICTFLAVLPFGLHAVEPLELPADVSVSTAYWARPNTWVVLGPLVALCAWIVWRQRGDARRVSPWALAATCVAVVGGHLGVLTANLLSTGASGAGVVAATRYGENVLLVAALLAAFALVRGLAWRRDERGRALAVAVLAWSLSWTWIQERLLLTPRASHVPADVQLVEVASAGAWLPDDGARPVLGAVDASGALYVDDVRVDVGGLGAALDAALASEGRDVEALALAADARAPYGAVAELVAAAQARGCWKLAWLVALPAEQRGLGGEHALRLYLPLAPLTAREQEDAQVLRLSFSGGADSASRTVTLDDVPVPLAQVPERVEPSWRALPPQPLTLAAPPEVPWGDVVHALPELPPRAALELAALEVLDAPR
ncbi:MAG: hypothetical protein H6828_08075 [Planctomycetes bacterium]|nr:hypothetical protein [Planctomycetota bacterium]